MDKVPHDTIQAYSRTVFQEAVQYGFSQLDIIRLINELMDLSADRGKNHASQENESKFPALDADKLVVDTFPLRSPRTRIRLADAATDLPLLQDWMQDSYGKHFLLSCATAQKMDVGSLLESPRNRIGIVTALEDVPIGAVAFLDIDEQQRRAELRKLIGVPDARGKGFAEEATSLWIMYGCEQLGLQKFYVSTLQTHLRNIRLNESIGFRVEGVLYDEVFINESRHDVLRMGLTASRFRTLLAQH